MAAALELISRQTSQALEGADFTPFGRKLSWQQLAQGCVVRLAADLLQLRDVAQAAEWADLLYHRLETRRAASVRTTNERRSRPSTHCTRWACACGSSSGCATARTWPT